MLAWGTSGGVGGRYMSDSHGDWTIVFADEAMVAAHKGCLLVLSWRTGAGLKHVEQVRALQEQLIADGRGPLCVVNIFSLEAKSGISDELRREGRQLFEQMVPHYFAQAYVVMGDGFWAAGIRAFLAAFTGLTAQRVQTKTFGAVEEAMTWLSEMEDQRPWLRTSVSERARQIEDVILSAHTLTPGAPSLRTFAPTKPQGIEIEEDDSGSGGPWTTSCGPVHVSYWTGAAIAADVARMQDDVAQLARKVGAPVVLLMFVAPGTPLSPAAARTRASVMLRDLYKVIDGVAIVSSGSGLWAMALRGMFRGIEMIVPTKIDWRTFGEVGPALGWLREVLDRRGNRIPGADDVDRAIDSLRVKSEALPQP